MSRAQIHLTLPDGSVDVFGTREFSEPQFQDGTFGQWLRERREEAIQRARDSGFADAKVRARVVSDEAPEFVETDTPS